jgi:ubiquinone/menaquinone biosynthesis C-methylase UbiE
VTEEARFQVKRDLIRKRLLKYTRRAFSVLPKLDELRILDIGCGTGIPTLQLARLTNGEIVALDINKRSLDSLTRKSQRAGISNRIKVMECSISEMEFPNESFDVIWAEGSIHVVGFRRGLLEWRRFLKPNGFLVIHDERESISEKLRHISSCGYELLDYFTLGEDTWWSEYFAPLEKLINEIRTKPNNDAQTLAVLDEEQREIQLFKKDSSRYCSAFFVMKKR